MMKSRITKILVLLLIIGLIMVKVFSVAVSASSIQEILEGNQITDENGGTSGLPTTNTPTTNTPTTNTPTTNTPTTNTPTTNTNTNKLPKTGANENVIIGLMVICAAGGIYAFKKVKEYNV